MRLDLKQMKKELLLQKRVRKNNNPYMKYLYWLYDEKKVIEETVLIQLFDTLDSLFEEDEIDAFLESYNTSINIEKFGLAPNITKRRAI